MKYDYYNAIRDDIREYIRNEIDLNEFDTIEALQDYLDDMLWFVDSVTGNASGSYTVNAWKAEEYICHNLDLLQDALSEFGYGNGYLLEQGAESADVIIRCHLLSVAIADVLQELEDAYNEAHEKASNES